MLKGKVAIVTGSTSGIGLGIAKVSAVIEHLDLKNAVHVGHATGGGQATRYVAAISSRDRHALLVGYASCSFPRPPPCSLRSLWLKARLPRKRRYR